MLAEELAELAPEKISLEIYNFVLDRPKVQEFQIDKIPALVVAGEIDYGIRFYGIPAGFEFTSLIETMMIIGNEDSGLSPLSKTELKKLIRPVNIQTFVMLTCPYCPYVAKIANGLAFESGLVTTHIIDVQEFPLLTNRYQVLGVPNVIIASSSETGELRLNSFEGAIPEEEFLKVIIQSAT